MGAHPAFSFSFAFVVALRLRCLAASRRLGLQMEHYLDSVVALLFVAVLSVLFCRKFGIPTMLGYLIAGFFAGPGFLGLLRETRGTEFVGEIGIAFLMFSIGLEFSLAKLKAMRHLVLGLGSAQVAMTTLVFMAIVMNMQGLSWDGAFVVGSAFAMSSTAIVSKIMSERSEMEQSFGQMTMGVLLMQDIAAVPIMIFAHSLGSGGEDLGLALALAALKMGVVLLLLLYIGEKLMWPLFRFIARQEISELFMLTVLFVALGVAYLTSLANLSLALGAFVAGMLIAETPFKMQVEDDIRPFKDILLGFFFITVGMKLQTDVLADNFIEITALVLGLLLLKFIVVEAIAARTGHDKRDSFLSAIYLAQGGEFGFVLLTLGVNEGLLDSRFAQIAVASILVSMMVSPFAIKLAHPLKEMLFKTNWDEQSVDLHTILVENMSKNDHVLIVGYGRVGQVIARIASSESLNYFALDLSADRVNAARLAGERVAYGDAKRADILTAAGAKRAKIAVITLSGKKETQHIIDALVKLRPSLPIVARCSEDENIDLFMNLGADEVVADSLEIGLGLASEALLYCGLPFTKTYNAIRAVRVNKYSPLEGLYLSADEIAAYHNDKLLYRDSLVVGERSYIEGKRLEDVPFKRFKVVLLGVRRQLRRVSNPSKDFALEAGDVLMVMAVPPAVKNLRDYMASGPQG